MKKTTLYQKDSKGRVKVWSCEVRTLNIREMAIIHTEAGLEGGKMTSEDTQITEGKNIGKANETNYYQQACLEAQSKIDAKIRAGYVADKSQIKESSELGSGVPQPMLAHKYDPKGKQSSSKTLKQLGLHGKKGSVQPKFDGHRRLIKLTPDGVSQYTRKGDLTESLPHISEQLTEVAKKFFANNKGNNVVTEVWLDGEAFSEEVSFNELSGLLRKEKGHTKEELEKRSKINIRLYDVIVNHGYEIRYSILSAFGTTNVIVVENHVIDLTDENLQKFLDKFLGEGHEGLMIRQHGIGYENKRSWQLCKFKIFEDEEMEIIGGEESVRRGMLGAFIVRDKKGNECKASLKFSHPERIEMWENLKKYVGQQATVEYFGRSEYGIPRFPKVKAIRKDV
jgi:ATP-dependent DNA ligase